MRQLLRYAAIFLSTIFLNTFQARCQNAYITYGQGTDKGIKVINTNTNTIVDSISAPFDIPNAVVTSPDGKRAYVTYFYNNNQAYSVINTATNTIINNFVLAQSGAGADGIDITPDGSTLYYAGISSNVPDTIYALNPATGTIKAKIVMPSSGVEGVAMNPNGQEVYIALGGTIQVINTSTNTLDSAITISTSNSPFIYGVAVSPDGSKVYAAITAYNPSEGYVAVVNTSTKSVIANILVSKSGGGTYGIAVDPTGTRVYATNIKWGNMAVIDAVNNTLIDTFPVGQRPYGLAVSKDGSKVYVANQTSGGSVTVFNTATNSILTTIPAGYGAVAFGKFIASPAPATTSGSYQATGAAIPVVSGNYYNSLTNGSGLMAAEINPQSNNLGSTAWGYRIYSGADIQNTYGWFGGNTRQYGAFLKRNIYITPTTQPGTATKVRIYCTNAEIQSFLTKFNAQYGTNKTIDDIRVIKYNGTGVDLSWTNNQNDSSKYQSIAPDNVGYYDFTNQYRFFEFTASSYSEFWLALTSPTGLLPLKLTRFTGRKQENVVLLNWLTSAEVNTSLFGIERSGDARSFVRIGSVKASGNTATAEYSFTDKNLTAGMLYYRLKMIDIDGRFTYSNIVSIKDSKAHNIEIYPNPVSKTLNFRVTDISALNEKQMKIVDMNGKTVKVISLTGMVATQQSIDVTDLQKGSYYLSVGDYWKQFIIQ